MTFLIYQNQVDRDRFFVTDEEHEKAALDRLSAKQTLTKIGSFPEMGRDRLAFNETLAKNAIRDHGFYWFTAKSLAPAGEPPATMP